MLASESMTYFNLQSLSHQHDVV